MKLLNYVKLLNYEYLLVMNTWEEEKAFQAEKYHEQKVYMYARMCTHMYIYAS